MRHDKDTTKTSVAEIVLRLAFFFFICKEAYETFWSLDIIVLMYEKQASLPGDY